MIKRNAGIVDRGVGQSDQQAAGRSTRISTGAGSWQMREEGLGF